MEFVWKPEYSVGVEEFDQQHRHFFELAAKVSKLSEQDGIDYKELLISINEFGDYSLYHMSSEESYFEKYGYPGAGEHKALHDKYRQDVRSYIDRAREAGEEERAKIAGELAEFSSDWLADHILEADKKYVAFFREKGVS